MATLQLALILIIIACARVFGQQAEIVYSWNRLEYDWPSESDRNAAISNKTYIPGRDFLAGIKLYKDEIYLTMPRWRWTEGIPVVLAKIINKNGKAILQPYPSWSAQKQGNCGSLQYVQSMEIDPHTGRMVVIDTGRIGNTLNICPPKIVVYDLITNREVDRYEFPENVVNRTNCFLNDIVLDIVNGQVRYAYISNTFESTIVVYDFKERSSFKLTHPTMGVESENAANINIQGINYYFPMPINGIAMSPDFKYVYYSSLAGYNLHQIPTSTLRNKAGTTGIRVVGRKTSQTDGLAHGSKRLYYGALGLDAVYFWDINKDLADQKTTLDKVTMQSQTLLKADNRTMEWADTFAFDGKGWLWIVATRLQIYWGLEALPETGDPFLRIWKIYVNETSYLNGAESNTINQGGNGAKVPFLFGLESRASIIFAVLAYITFMLISREF